jgi:hypothetical protein
LRDAKLDVEVATHLLGVLQLSTNRGILHVELAKAHIALAGCPVE